MKRLMCSAISLIVALPAFAQGPEGLVGNWKSDPGTPTMTRKLALHGKMIVMTKLQPGRSGIDDNSMNLAKNSSDLPTSISHFIAPDMMLWKQLISPRSNH